MKVNILSGIYASVTNGLDYRVAYPMNLYPVIVNVGQSSGVSESALTPANGIVLFASGSGVDRGGFNWNGVLYRAMGSKLVSVSSTGVITILGEIGGTTQQVVFDASFDRLGIASNNNLFYWNGTTLTQVTDPDLGVVLDMIWVDGYFMTTDGTNLVVTELSDPTAVNPLKYGSAESSPDPIRGLIKVRNEVYALGRYTIEVFQNVGGAGFPFVRKGGAIIQRGVLSSTGSVIFEDSLYFIGGAFNESISLHVALNGSSQKIAPREIDLIFQGYTQAQLATILLEKKVDNGEACLYIHLPDKTLVYDLVATQLNGGIPIWYILSSSTTVTPSQYRARNFVRIYDKWIVGDPLSNNLGKFSRAVGSHYDIDVYWEFSTNILFNEGRKFIIHEIELFGIFGRVTGNPLIYTSQSTDGVTWSAERSRSAGAAAQYDARVNWFQNGIANNMRIQKFRGLTDAHITITSLEMRVEALK